MGGGNPAIPGIETLGLGFNPFDATAAEFGPSAFRGSLISFQGPGGEDYMSMTAAYQANLGGVWQVPPGSGDPLAGQAYQVPADVAVQANYETTGSSGRTIFDTYQEISQYFSTQVGIADVEGPFAGSAAANFSTSDYESNSYFYGINESFANRWAVSLDNALLFTPTQTNGSTIDPNFLAAAEGVPTKFDSTSAGSVARFQSFFQKYGTHIVSSVTVGARSRLSVSIERSSNITESNAQSDISAEYDFVSGSLGTKVSYKDGNYLKSRHSQLMMIGGNQELAEVATANPTEAAPAPDSTLTNYQNWLASTGQNPTTIQLTLAGIWNLAVFNTDQQGALQAAYQYFALPNTVLPFYSYEGSYSSDYLYTTLENPEGSQSHLHWSSYKYLSTPFYVLPQGTTCSSAITLHRFYNDSFHFFTTNLEADADLIKNGHYREDYNYYSKVLPLQVSGLNNGALVTIYRWEVPGGGHYFATTPDAAPHNAVAFDGPQYTAFQNPPSDPFSLSLESASGGITGVIEITYSTPARMFLKNLGDGAAAAETALQQALQQNIVLRTQADLHTSPRKSITQAVGAAGIVTAEVYVMPGGYVRTTPPHITPALFAATNVQVMNLY